jgi:alpha-L-arabinofuranosidase/glucose/arabinose dehydrogenase
MMNRRRVSRVVSRLAIAIAFSLTAFVANWTSARNYLIERIASGLDQPTYVTQAPSDPANILYFTERTKDANPGFLANNGMGSVWRYDVDTRSKTLVLDLSSRSVTQDTGLQTIAFHPDFNTPATPGYGKLYVSSSQAGSTALNRVEEYAVDLSGPTPTYAATFTRTLLQYQNNAQLNHTIDWVGFDPTAVGDARNYLYITTGDGSFGNNYNGGVSPTGRPSQDPNDVAGKMLRIDVGGADAYPADPLKNFAIPASNPIPTYNAANPGLPISGLGEVYVTGLRNVYRASFDRANGDLWMGDVGETSWEEVDFLKAGTNVSGPPVDYGWPQREGTVGANYGNPPPPTATVNPFTGVTALEPLQQFPHDGGGEAIIGGYVYRGPVPELQGQYFYTDFVGTANAAQIWSLDFDRNTNPASFNGQNGARTEVSSLWQSLVYDPTDPAYLPDSTTASSAGLDHIVSFGEDNAGNVYLVDFGNGSGFDGQYPGAGRGEIFRIVPSLPVTVTVNRTSGVMTLANQTGAPIDIRGYSIASASGALDRDELAPISGRLDAMPSGDGTIDPNNIWQVTSPSGSHTLFSESSTGGATILGVGQSFELSPADGWIPSIYEDLDLRLTLGDGSVVDAIAQYTGNSGQAFERSDLNFNGGLDPGDWVVFRTHHLTNLAGLSKAQSYGLGDLDGDGDNDFTDFRLFQRDYTSINGAAAFARLLTVPEPGTLTLLLAIVATACCHRSRRSTWRPFWFAIVVMAGGCFVAAHAKADLVRQYTFNDGTANDSIGSANGTLNGNAVVSLGALDLSGEGDYVSLPATTINVNSFTDATFEAWFTFRGGAPWQRVFDFGRTVSTLGRDYIFYTPNSGSGDNRAGFRDSNLAEDTAIGGATLSINSPHHVAVVVDDNANGGTNRMTVYVDGMFGGDTELTYSFSDFSTSNRLAYLGRSLFGSDAYFNGQIDEFRIHDNALTAQDVHDSFVAGPVPSGLLELEVNTVTGAVTVRNQHSAPLAFDYYRIASESGALEPATWNSLDQQNIGAIGSGEGESWDELGSPDTQEVAELFLLGGSTLASSASLDLGRLYDPSVVGTRHDGDLVFQYALQGENQLRQGVITYEIPPPLPGDYSDNGVVDAADYTVWRNHLNSTFQLPNEVAGVSDGMVTLADYDAWKQRFGNVLGGSGAGAGTVAVPEPGCAWLATIALWLCAIWRRGSGGRQRAGWVCLAMSMGVVVHGAEPDARITIDTRAAGTPVPRTLHGVFFEDINYGADGGLYAELIQNRSFEHSDPRYAWSVRGPVDKARFEITDESPLNANNPHFARISVDGGTGDFGLVNSGFDGITLNAGEAYLVSLYARAKANGTSALVVRLEGADGKTVAAHKFSNLRPTWQKLDAEFRSPKSIADGRLAVLVMGGGTVDVDMVSLFPRQTFQNRRNGLRRDLAQALADMKPGFFRFPGGCIVEGMDLANAYRWKDTIGDVAERKQNYNLWRDERSPQYQQTYGLGFFEYFQFCEDIGAEPVPVVNCGMSCQARRRGTHVPLAELGPWIQDALDLIEFANGPVTSQWGQKRAAMGHAEPFGLEYLAVGNEQWNEEYFARYMPFYEAIKQEHPEIKIISTSGPNVSGDLYQYAWEKFRTGTPADVVDEHYYVPPRWLLENPDWYAKYDPRGPKVFVGEFAGHDGRGRRNNLRAALSEAAYMTGLVRHSEIVAMASYAPLFGKFGHDQWHPNLIWFDNERAVLTPSYYVQALFSQNLPDSVLPIKVDSDDVSTRSSGMVGVGTWNTQAEYKDVTVTAPDGEILYRSDFTDPDELERWQTAGGSWDVRAGTLRQDSIATDVRAVVGDPRWTDYTLRLKARKLGGDEGFLILFHTAGIDRPTWWNIGGWNDTSHAIQESEFPESHVRGSIETGRWYDVRVELSGGTVRAYLDDELIHFAKAGSSRQLYAAAGVDETAGEIVVEVVNPTASACDVAISLLGYGAGSADAKLITLTADTPDRENSLNDPNRVAPRGSTVSVAAEFSHTVPPYALEVLRIPQSAK